jgi:hypothetical protein
MKKLHSTNKQALSSTLAELQEREKELKRYIKKQHKKYCNLRRQQDDELKDAINEDCSKTMKKVRKEMKYTKKAYDEKKHKLQKEYKDIRRKIRKLHIKQIRKDIEIISDKAKLMRDLHKQKMYNLEQELKEAVNESVNRKISKIRVEKFTST